MNMFDMRKVGETFNYKGVMLRIVRHDSSRINVCDGCYFDNQGICMFHDESVTGQCYDNRKLINVVFKKVEGGSK